MKVAYLVNRYPAVSHSFIRREINGLEKAGVEILRFSVRRPGDDLPDPDDQREAAATTVILDAGAAALSLSALRRLATAPGRFFIALKRARAMAPGLVRAFAYVVEACWLADRLRAQSVDHLHAHFGTNPAAVARLASLFADVPYSFTVHGPDEFDAPLALDLPGKIADAALVVAISDYGRSQLYRWAATDDWAKIAVVRCGVDSNWGRGQGVAQGEAAADLCTVARLAPQKGIHILLEALAILARRGSRPALALIGDGPMRADLERRAAALGLSAQVRFLGSRDGATVHDLMARCTLFVLPSFAEGLPVVIMEALAAGAPVIATTIAGIPELVDAEDGWLVKPGSPAALADAIEAGLAASQEHRRQLAACGAARVARDHSSEANARQLADLFAGAAG